MDVIFTIVSRNYAAQAATLMQSLAAAEPEARRVVVATDGPLPALAPFAEVIDAGDLDAPFAEMSVYYDALELNTAVKPYAFRRLLGEAGSVTYLDPDIYVFRPLSAIREALQRAELALIPHLTRPLTGEALPNDQAILSSGVYNLGFLAARPTPKVKALMAWWAERCRFDCRVDFEAGLFTDQRWMDLAPGFVDELAILRDPALNLAYWSLDGRELSKGKDGWMVDGRPLAFFHFSGFDPARPEVLSKHQDRIRVRAGSPLAALLQDYAERLLANGHAQASAIPYGHGRFPSGAPVTKPQRLAALAAARSGERFEGLTERVEARLTSGLSGVVRQAADRFETPPREDLVGWLKGKTPSGRARALEALLAARADLRARFVDDEPGLLAWALGVEAPARRFAPELLAPDVLAGLARDAAPLLGAARFADPDASELKQRLSAAFGLADRGRWPEAAAAPLRAPFFAPSSHGAPFIGLFEAIWESRTDLQRAFPLRTLLQRFRFLRWLIGGGLAAYDVSPAQLPPAVRNHPLFVLASTSLGEARPRGPAPRRDLAELWVVEGADAALEAAADRAVYEPGSGRFLGPHGAAVPGRVAFLRFHEPAAFIAADAMALYAHDVRWERVEGL